MSDFRPTVKVRRLNAYLEDHFVELFSRMESPGNAKVKQFIKTGEYIVTGYDEPDEQYCQFLTAMVSYADTPVTFRHLEYINNTKRLMHDNGCSDLVKKIEQEASLASIRSPRTSPISKPDPHLFNRVFQGAACAVYRLYLQAAVEAGECFPKISLENESVEQLFSREREGLVDYPDVIYPLIVALTSMQGMIMGGCSKSLKVCSDAASLVYSAINASYGGKENGFSE